ncbi:MAG TPA: ABC transporter substrate-binding protein [Methylomirabilota bacterium]
MAGTAGLVGARPEPVTAEPPPETTRLRLVQRPVICFAPVYVAEALFRDEGFTDVAYLKKLNPSENYQALASGEADINFGFGPPLIARIDAGDPIVFIAGGHVGCLQLFGTDHVRTLHDLKGKAVASAEGTSLFLASMLSYIGLDPGKDATLVVRPEAEATQLFVDGKVDAVMVSPPFPQELAARKIGRLVINTAVDRPWSNYFCCMVTANREFVRKHPVATKRALRAIVKGADLCALEPERVARSLVERGFTPRHDYALLAIKDVPYRKWREYDPEDTVRFYALRLHEVGMIKSSPQKIIAQGTDWRFLKELKKELKA